MTSTVTRCPEEYRSTLPPAPERSERLLPSELDFYLGYRWCLNPFPTVRDTAAYLEAEIDKLAIIEETWQTGEVMTNVYLLSCALLNAAEEYLRGQTLRLPRKLAGLRLLRAARWVTETVMAIPGRRRRADVRRWAENWQGALDAFLALLVAGGTHDQKTVAAAGKELAMLLRSPLPGDLQAEHIYFPSAFRRLDLTHLDILALGRQFVARFPQRRQPVMLLGLRTAGSYFAPLLRAFLQAEGYESIAIVTVHPDKGPGARERAGLRRCAEQGCLAVILDDPPHTGDTIVLAVAMARQAGFSSDKVTALLPVHPARRDWGKSLALSGTVILSLEPEQWHKQRLLAPKEVESRLTEYANRRGWSGVVASSAADRFNASLQMLSDDPRRTRLKQVYEVRLQSDDGECATRYVFAKSVGWGWLGYHAFIAGHKLTEFTPPLLGLRDGILFTEFVPQSKAPSPAEDREQWIRTAAAYVAARVRALRLPKNPLPSFGLHRHHDGFRLLEKVLSKAYGGIAGVLMRPRLLQRLCAQRSPIPTLIDGKMQCAEWITGPHGPLKTDYEHHGMGKNELNAIDPAYDLADAILQLTLSAQEEDLLIREYIEQTADVDVESRLFLNKYLAGAWALASARQSLFHAPQQAGVGRWGEFNERFINAWHFLTVQTARFCGAYCQPPAFPRWGSPLVALDIDGVLDRRIFGFPCTTAAGIQALSLLHGHEFAVAVDTARSVAEVKEYCQAYGFVGGVAEYGSYIWDAVNRRGRTLVTPDSLEQLETARNALRRLPGVFLDERYNHSIRAYTFEDKAAMLGRVPLPSPLRALLSLTTEEQPHVPLPTLTVRHLLASLKLDRLCVQQTTIDTTILAKEVDKGSGLAALLSWVGQAGADVTAIGDSEPDLPMFRLARRSFAPAQISGARLARLLGCRIDRQRYQRGLLSIVRRLAHPRGGHCPRCAARGCSLPRGKHLFLDLLRAADLTRSAALARALTDPKAYRLFLRS